MLANGECKRPNASASANAGSEKPPSNPASAPASSIDDSLKRIAEAQEALVAATKPSDEKDREQRDLEAQQEMACWAQWMFYATAFGALVAVFGTALLLATVRQARTSAEQQLRAYVMVESINVTWPGKGLLRPPSGRGPSPEYFVASVKVKNSGATPARKMTAHIDCDSFAETTADRPQEHGVRVIGPGHDDTFEFRQEVVDDVRFLKAVDALISGAMTFCVSGTISYEDAFGHPRKTYFRHAGRRIYNNGAEVVACEKGNDYT